MKNLTSLAIASTESFDTIGTETLLIKTETNRWFLADALTGNLLTSGFSSSTLATDKLSKIEDSRAKGNMMGFRFGSKRAPRDLKAFAAIVWGDLFALKSVKFDGHYWWTKVVSSDGKVSESVRADYFINYLRIPAGLESDAAIEVATVRGVRWED